MHPGCYSGYNDDDDSGSSSSFFFVYGNVFQDIVACERKQTEILIELPTDFGSNKSEWKFVVEFYQVWESFSSSLNFAWEDKYNSREDAPNRRVRRLMDDENKKSRRNAKKTYNQDILALVSFIKRRDPRVRARQELVEKQKLEQQQRQKELVAERKREQQKAKEVWKEEAARAMLEAEEEDRLAGRVRLADLEDDYDYGYGGKGKKKKKKKKGKKNRFIIDDDDDDDNNQTDDLDQEPTTIDDDGEDNNENLDEQNTDNNLEVDNEVDTDQRIGQQDITTESENDNLDTEVLPEEQYDDDEEYFSSSEEEEEEEEEPDIWRCECCRKEFKSVGQMENHMKSKKHKEAFKKYQAKMKKQQQEEEDNMMAEMMDDLTM